MSESSKLKSFRKRLFYDLSSENQKAILGELWSIGSLQALKIMADALSAPQVQVKQAILEYLSFSDDSELFEHLTWIMSSSSEATRWTIKKAIEQEDLTKHYLEKLGKLRQSPDKYTLLAAVIRFLGTIGNSTITNEIQQLFSINDERIQQAVINTIKSSLPDSCPMHLLRSLPHLDLKTAGMALDVIGAIRDSDCAPFLLSLLGEIGGLMADKIVLALNGFSRAQLEAAVIETVGTQRCITDVKLYYGWRAYLKRTGNFDEARRFKMQFEKIAAQMKAPPDDPAHQNLTFEFKDITGIALLQLKGELNLYTLRRLEKILRSVIKEGYTRIILVGSHLVNAGQHTAAYLAHMESELKKSYGGIRLVNFSFGGSTRFAGIIPESVFFDDMAEALYSFSGGSQEEETDKVIGLSENNFRPGDRLEVTYKPYKAGDQELHRSTEIISLDGNKMSLKWEVLEESETFKEFENDHVALTFTVDDYRVRSESRVCKQGDSLHPAVSIMIPRTARTVRPVTTPYVECHLIVTFRKLLSRREVSETEYPGICLILAESELLLTTPLPLKEKSNIVFELDAPPLKSRTFAGQVTRRVEHVSGEKRYYEYTIMFVPESHEDRMAIRKYIDEQLP